MHDLKNDSGRDEEVQDSTETEGFKKNVTVTIIIQAYNMPTFDKTNDKT